MLLPELLTVSHTEQKYDGDCLVACADMALQYVGRFVPYKRLIRLLRTNIEYGTPFSNISYLEKLRVTIEQGNGTIERVIEILNEGYPIIVLVNTGELPNWASDARHAVVVVGIDEVHVWVHDPTFAKAPLKLPFGDFDLAWLAMYERYAVIRP